jgi:hypothetical protein
MSRVALSSVLLSLAWFAAVNLVASHVARVLAPLLLRTRLAARPDVLFALRLMPAAVAALFVAAMFLPAHWRFEPADVRESFGVVLWAFAVAGGALVVRSALRLVRAGLAGWRLRACSALPPMPTGDPGVERVYEVDGLAGVSLAGVWRPRILVGRAVRAALTPPELDVAIAHERAHHRANDNLKRLAIYCAPDYFGRSRGARRVEAQWRATVEWTADARAVAGERSRALALASALVKVARLAGGRIAPSASPVWSTLHEAALLDARVRRLIAPDVPAAQRLTPAAFRLALVTLAALLAGAAAAADIHDITERLVRLLP